MHCIEHWTKKLSKRRPKVCSKHVWTLLETTMGNFGFLKFFWIFWKFLKARPSMEHWAKFFFEKIAPKQVQGKFGHFRERFWAFLDFWKIWDFSKSFEDSMEHWVKKNFSKKSPKTCSKHVWIHLQTILGLFGFLKFFEDSTLHGTVGKNFLSKRKPQNPFGHLGTILDISRNLKLFWFFSRIFSKYPPQNISPENWIQIF